jgi:hypothetical protein
MAHNSVHNRSFTPDEMAVIHERRHGWEKASCALLAKIFNTTPQEIAAICKDRNPC